MGEPDTNIGGGQEEGPDLSAGFPRAPDSPGPLGSVNQTSGLMADNGTIRIAEGPAGTLTI